MKNEGKILNSGKNPNETQGKIFRKILVNSE